VLPIAGGVPVGERVSVDGDAQPFAIANEGMVKPSPSRSGE
jgi:hypothetical protein